MPLPGRGDNRVWVEWNRLAVRLANLVKSPPASLDDGFRTACQIVRDVQTGDDLVPNGELNGREACRRRELSGRAGLCRNEHVIVIEAEADIQRDLTAEPPVVLQVGAPVIHIVHRHNRNVIGDQLERHTALVYLDVVAAWTIARGRLTVALLEVLPPGFELVVPSNPTTFEETETPRIVVSPIV